MELHSRFVPKIGKVGYPFRDERRLEVSIAGKFTLDLFDIQSCSDDQLALSDGMLIYNFWAVSN